MESMEKKVTLEFEVSSHLEEPRKEVEREKERDRLILNTVELK